MAGGKRDIEAGAAYVRVFLKKTEFERGLVKLRSELTKIGDHFTKTGAVFTAAGAALVGTIVKATMDFAAFGDVFDKMAIRTGISVESLSELKYAAEQSGATLETVEKSVRRMQRAIGEASSGMATYVDAFAALGLSVADLQGLSPERQFELVASRIAAIADPTKRAAAAMEIFGLSGTELLPMITGDMEALRQKARDLGLQMSTEDAKAAAAFGDAVNRMKNAALMAWYKIGAAATPVLEKITEAVRDFAIWAQKWIDEHRDLVVAALEVGGAIAAVGTVLVGLGTALSIAAIAVKGFTAALWILTAHPIVAAIAAVAAGVAGVATVIYLATKQTAALQNALDGAAKSGKKLSGMGAPDFGDIESDKDAQKKIASFTEGLAERLHDLRLRMIEDEQQRALAALRHRHAEELKAAEEEKRLAIEIAAMRRVQALEEAALLHEQIKKREEAEKRFRDDLDADLEELRIRAAKEGLDEDLAILELEKKREIEAAQELYPDRTETWRSGSGDLVTQTIKGVIPPEVLAAIEEKYGLKEQIAKEMYKPQQADMAPTGTFSGYALAALGGGSSPQERTAKGVAALVEKIAELLGLTEDQTRVLRDAMPEFD